MKINLLLLSLIFSCNLIFSQNISVESINRFETGELLEYRLHYGIFNTSYASLKLNNVILDNKSVYHAAGYGKTTGLARLFLKLRIIMIAILMQVQSTQYSLKEILMREDILKILK